jgi:hypothetical protein
MSARKLPLSRPGHEYKSWHVHVSPGHTYADLFDPNFWADDRSRLNQNDLVRVVADDGSFDVMLTVTAKSVTGVVMEPWPKVPAGYRARPGRAGQKCHAA